MLNHTKIAYTNRWCLFAGLLFFSSTVWSQSTLSRTIEQDLGDLQNGSLTVEHHRGELHIRQSADAHAHLSMEISARGHDEDEVNRFIESITIERSGSEKDLKIKTADQIASWQINMGSSKIKLKDGTVFKGIKELELNLVIEVPELATLRLANKYDDIHIGGFMGDLYVKLYTGELYAKDISKSLNLDLKYGSAEVGNVGDAALVLYESELEMKDAAKVTIDSKYSQYNIGGATSLSLVSYEDEIITKNVSGDVQLDVKYGDLEMGSLGTVAVTFYETDFTAGQSQKFTGNMKYGKVSLESADLFQLASNYETDIELGRVAQLVLQESKYGSVEVGQLNQSADVTAYETSLEVDQVGDQFRSLKVDSKYEYIDFPLPANLSYSLDAELKYGELEYAESLFAHKHSRVEKNSAVTVSAASSDAPTTTLIIRGYETNVDLRAQ